MSVHNQVSFNAVPELVKMNEIFEIYDSSAWKFAECVKADEPHTAAQHLQVMARLDAWFAQRRFEA